MSANIEENTEKNTEEREAPLSDSEIQDSEEVFESYQDDTTDEDGTRYKQGDEITFVRVRFPGNAKSFPFTFGSRKFAYGQTVLAQSDRGMTVGYINSFPYQVAFHKNMLPIRSIYKAATQEDIAQQKSFIDREKNAEKICIKLIDKYELDMNLTHVEYIQFGKKAVFYFTAPARVDFRELVKSLVSELKVRIELRQISVRDRAAAVGAIGACGLQTCCSSFLRHYGNVSIKMAKNQNLALIPTKINGVCGQLKCCIKYEDDVYTDKRKRLPKENKFIQTIGGDRGKVIRLHIILEQFEMITDQGKIRRYAANQFDPEVRLPKEWKFPNSFDHVVSETANIIGLEPKKQKKTQDSYFYDETDEQEDDSYDNHNGEDFEDDDE